MKKNGAEVVPVYSGSQTLVDAVSECMRYWVSNCDNTHMCVGSTVGPNIFVKICGWSTAQISRELKIQIQSEFKKCLKKLNLLIVWVVEVLLMGFGVSLSIITKNKLN